MHEFFNLNPTHIATVVLWYLFCIGGGLLFVGLAIRLQSQGQAVLQAQAQPTKRRKSGQVKPTSVAESAPDPLLHAPYRARLALALYLTAYLLLISLGLGLAAPNVRIACQRGIDQRVDCTVREFVWLVAPSRHAVIRDVRMIHEYSSRSSSNTFSSRPTGGDTYALLTNGGQQTLTTQTKGVAETIRQWLLTPTSTKTPVVVWGRPSWLGLAISLALLLVALLIGGAVVMGVLSHRRKAPTGWQRPPE
jgi:hypothetical protein